MSYSSLSHRFPLLISPRRIAWKREPHRRRSLSMDRSSCRTVRRGTAGPHHAVPQYAAQRHSSHPERHGDGRIAARCAPAALAAPQAHRLRRLAAAPPGLGPGHRDGSGGGVGQRSARRRCRDGRRKRGGERITGEGTLPSLLGRRGKRGTRGGRKVPDRRDRSHRIDSCPVTRLVGRNVKEVGWREGADLRLELT
jgi:hypothetical protein